VSVRVLHRPARIESCDSSALDAECRAARWLHHRLLDFEDLHQAELNRVADMVAPGVVRVGRILSRLARRDRRRERTTEGAWSPDPRPELASHLKGRLAELRAVRNADPRWKAALGWADEEVGAPKKVRRRKAKDPSKVVRRKTETDDAFRKRFDLLTKDESDEHYAAKLATPPRDTRRDEHRKGVYREIRCHWSTYNGVVKAVDAARSAVLKRRKQGLSGEWRRPRWSDPVTVYAEPGCVRVVERASPWWVVEMRLRDGWVRFRTKGGNWHAVPDDARILGAQLTRRSDGERWVYTVSITMEMEDAAASRPEGGGVAFDWGYREHGHPNASAGLRVFSWLGTDGERGEVLLPTECRTLLDTVDELKSRSDHAWNARKASLALEDRTRFGYRRRLMRLGVRTVEQSDWLRWEMRQERRVARCRKRIDNLRKETYLQAVQSLRRRYKCFVFEDEQSWSLKKQAIEEQGRRRQRSNRDLSARYLFVTLCERSGADVITVPARNTTRECPDCGFLGDNGPDLLYACPGCGLVRDKDDGARRVILARAKEALAERGVAA